MLVLLGAFPGYAQPTPLAASKTIISQSAYMEVSRGPHSRDMQRVTVWTNIVGKVLSAQMGMWNSLTECRI